MRCCGCVALVVCLLAAIASAAEPKTSDPKSAAKAFAQALADGDTDTAEKLFDGDDASKALIKPMAAVATPFKKLSKAATTKFGEDAKQLFSKSPGEKLVEKIDAAETRIDASEAVVIRSGSNKDDPIRLRNIGSGWKVYKLSDSLLRSLPEIQVTPKAMDAVTEAVERGDYRTARGALDAVRIKTRELSAATARQ